MGKITERLGVAINSVDKMEDCHRRCTHQIDVIQNNRQHIGAALNEINQICVKLAAAPNDVRLQAEYAKLSQELVQLHKALDQAKEEYLKYRELFGRCGFVIVDSLKTVDRLLRDKEREAGSKLGVLKAMTAKAAASTGSDKLAEAAKKLQGKQALIPERRKKIGELWSRWSALSLPNADPW